MNHITFPYPRTNGSIRNTHCPFLVLLWLFKKESSAMFADKLTNVCSFLHLNRIICGASVSISLQREASG